MDNASEFLHDSDLSTVLLILGIIVTVVLFIYIYPLINRVWSCINKAICLFLLLSCIGIWIGVGIVEEQASAEMALLQKGLTDVNEFLH